MMRMFTTTYGESVSCTPICDMGDPIGPMLNGSTYMVRPRMHPLNSPFSFLRISNGIYPVVRRPGVVFRQRADECAVLHPSHIARIRARVIAARPKLLVQLDESAASHHLGAQRLVLFFRSIHPMDAVRLGQLGHFLHPTEQVFVAAQGLRKVARVLRSSGAHVFISYYKLGAVRCYQNSRRSFFDSILTASRPGTFLRSSSVLKLPLASR